MKKIQITGIILGLTLLLAISGCTSNNSTGLATAGAVTTNNPATANAGAANLAISIPLEKISEQAKWFEYDSEDAIIRFFAVKGSDGSIKTAFDACDVCYYSKKGYSQQGTYMVCNNCGNKYPIDGLGTENRNPGGCWPSYLPNRLEGDKVVIEKADLEKGRGKFI